MVVGWGLLHDINMDKRMSAYVFMLNSLPRHVTTLQKMYGPIPVLFTICDRYRQSWSFLSHGAGNALLGKDKYTPSSTQGVQKDMYDVKVVLFETATNYKCHLSSSNIKSHIKIYI